MPEAFWGRDVETVVCSQGNAADQIQYYQQRLRELASELSMAEERERRAIAVELHDQIGQTLALTRMRLSELRGDLIFQGYDRQLAEIQHFVEDAIRYTRTLTSELSSSALYELGFCAGIQSLANQMQKKHGVAIDVHVDGWRSDSQNSADILLFKSVRELLMNVIKHAKAKRAVVTLQETKIVVCDDGVGFVPQPLKTMCSDGPKTFGIFSICERLTHIGGSMEIKSAPGAGTTVTLWLEPEVKTV